jgi:hypothetical protein
MTAQKFKNQINNPNIRNEILNQLIRLNIVQSFIYI